MNPIMVFNVIENSSFVVPLGRTETVLLFQSFSNEFRPRRIEDHPTLFFLYWAECLRGQQFDAAHPLAFLECVNDTDTIWANFIPITPCIRDP